MEDMNSHQYWEHRYLENNTQWDIGYPSTPITAYMDSMNDKEIRILIPGCGNAHEAKYILDQGFNDLTLIDIASLPVKKLKDALSSFGTKVKILEADFFELDEQFDLIIEQTFFCALTPDKRIDYVKKMQQLLKPNGKLVGVLFNRTFDSGPPFGGSAVEYEKLFSSYFNDVDITPCHNSIPSRQGAEVFINIS